MRRRPGTHRDAAQWVPALALLMQRLAGLTVLADFAVIFDGCPGARRSSLTIS
jgi:hypothetical protein